MKTQLRWEEAWMQAAELGPPSCVPDLLGEQILQNTLEFELDEDDEIYEGYGRRPNAFPYRQLNCYTRPLQRRKIRQAVLENDALRAVFLPEYGGRLWSLLDKVTGRNLLYTNDVLRFGNLAVCNAWFSGGVEWNMGVIGHTPFTARPLYTARLEDGQGNPVLRMYEYERVRGVSYQMDFWIEEGGRCLNCRMRLVNGGGEVTPMYWWSNIAVPEEEGGSIIVPADRAYTPVGGATVRKVDLPMVDGVDVMRYTGIPKSVDYFFAIDREEPKYIAHVDREGYGLLQVSTDRLQGRKLFSWGRGTASDRWQEFLTEGAGRYVEIQAGLGKTQYGCLPMAPHTAWEWMEQYGPVQLQETGTGATHGQLRRALTEQLQREQVPQRLERTLRETRAMAKARAGQFLQAGSGYGALVDRGRGTEHLDFLCGPDGNGAAGREQDGDWLRWRRFLERGILHEPDPRTPPDEFLAGDDVFRLLQESVEREGRANWYAHYQLGVAYLVRGRRKRAKRHLERSLSLQENAWAYHALACLDMERDRPSKAAIHILKGIALQKEEVSYLKEGFKILSLCGADRELCEAYDGLGQQEQGISRLRFYYITSLHRLGQDGQAYALLEQDGGLELEDIREGEESVAQLWAELYESLYGVRREAPYRYQFKAY